MKPYSREFRGEVLAACDRGCGTREVATHFKVSESWVPRLTQERRELNKIAPCLTRRRTPLWAAIADRMREVIREKPDLTLRELRAELQTDLSVQTLCTALHKLRLAVTKKILIATERERPDVAERREELKREQQQLNPDRLVFIDDRWQSGSPQSRGRS